MFDLSLENEDLMAKRENLCVTLIATHQEQPEPSDHEPKQVRKDR